MGFTLTKMARVVWLLVSACLLGELCCTRATLSKSDKKKSKSELQDEVRACNFVVETRDSAVRSVLV